MKPILFNTEMVRAILDDQKTATRRVVKLKYSNTHLAMRTDKYGTRLIELQNEEPGVTTIRNPDGTTTHRLLAAEDKIPPYRPGDILYVRETWTALLGSYLYKADQKPGMKNPGKWHPSIHMPKEAARLFLRVMDVRAERLLTPFFAPGAAIMELRKEGITLPGDCAECIENYGNPCCIDAEEDSECGILDEVRGEFSDLWDSTIKKADLPRYGWNANPWVWVIEFERISKETAKKGGDAP